MSLLWRVGGSRLRFIILAEFEVFNIKLMRRRDFWRSLNLNLVLSLLTNEKNNGLMFLWLSNEYAHLAGSLLDDR